MGAVPERNVARFLDALQEPGPDGLSTEDHVQAELQELAKRDPDLTKRALQVLASKKVGKPLIEHFYFGGWHSGPRQRFKLIQGNNLLDPRAFLPNGFGCIFLGSFYNTLFLCFVIAHLKFERDTYDWTDAIIIFFWIGQVVEESRELFVMPGYFHSFWNLLDSGIISLLVFHYIAAYLSFDGAARAFMAGTCLFLMLRVMASLRNMQFFDLGANIRIAIDMLRSIAAFLILQIFVLFSFAVTFFFLFVHVDAETQVGKARKGHIDDAPSALRDFDSFPFSNIWSTLLWLFNASLGDFHFEVFDGTHHALAGCLLLVVYSFVSAVILMNFMIAILSGIYEQHCSDSQTRFAVDMGLDTIDKSYLPAAGELPWLPRPMNLVTMLVRLVLIDIAGLTLRLVCGPSRFKHRMRELRVLHIKVQLACHWLFGNVVIFCTVEIFRLVLLPVVVLALMVFSPISSIVFCVNLLNGEVMKIYRRAASSSNGSHQSFRERVKHFDSVLTPAQRTCCLGVLIGVVATIVCAISYVISLCFQSVGFLDDDDFNSLFQRLLGPASANIMLPWPARDLLATYCILVWVGALVELLRWRLFRQAGEKPWWTGFSVLLTQAMQAEFFAHPDGTSPAAVEFPEEMTALLTERPRHVLRARTAVERATHFPSDGAATESDYEGTDRRLRQALARGRQPKLADNVRSLTAGVLSRPCDDVKNMNVSMFLTLLLDVAIESRPLIPQALDAIRKNEEISLFKFGRYAVYITLDDFYRVACSLIRGLHRSDSCFRLLPTVEVPALDVQRRRRLLHHSVFGLYCIEDDSTEEVGVFFEDYFWALWTSSLLERSIHIKELLCELESQADAWVVDLEDVDDEGESFEDTLSLLTG
eukprot:TRINITY_DN29309_c0_g1_i3.p1 TRINITY_DN29309_c0_g1~~TRINITY_DN29309_c0_g1_i3.p1  ORF type:complete len:872 (-),score=87.76 TRINITY_DN29309_c0_g1_i3:78-2693(-)